MMKTTTQEPRLICRENEDDTLCTAFFETRSFEELGWQLMDWLAERPEHEVVSLSHSTGGRWEKRYDRISWGKVEPVSFYTALLVFRSVKRAT